MSHFFTEEQLLMQEAVKQFVDDEVRPRALEADEADEFPMDLYKRCVELGLVGMTAPAEYGGIENGYSTFLMVLEEIGRVLPNLALGLEVNEFCISAISVGSEEQKAKYLPGLIDGSQFGGVFCTDPSGSVNHQEWPVHIAKAEGGYVVNSSKVMVSYRSAATMCVLQVKYDDGGIGFVIVPDMSVPEVEIGADYIKLGMHGSQTGDVTVTDLFVPDADVIPVGVPLDVNIWLNMAAIALGAAQEGFDKTLPYLLERTKAGKPIATLNGTGRALADWAVDLELGRNMLYNVAAMLERGDDPITITKMCCMTKAWVVRMACRRLSDAVELNGSIGYIEEYGIARLLRDVHGLRLAEYSENMVMAIVEQCIGIPDIIV